MIRDRTLSQRGSANECEKLERDTLFHSRRHVSLSAGARSIDALSDEKGKGILCGARKSAAVKDGRV